MLVPTRGFAGLRSSFGLGSLGGMPSYEEVTSRYYNRAWWNADRPAPHPCFKQPGQVAQLFGAFQGGLYKKYGPAGFQWVSGNDPTGSVYMQAWNAFLGGSEARGIVMSWVAQNCPADAAAPAPAASSSASSTTPADAPGVSVSDDTPETTVANRTCPALYPYGALDPQTGLLVCTAADRGVDTHRYATTGYDRNRVDPRYAAAAGERVLDDGSQPMGPASSNGGPASSAYEQYFGGGDDGAAAAEWLPGVPNWAVFAGAGLLGFGVLSMLGGRRR